MTAFDKSDSESFDPELTTEGLTAEGLSRVEDKSQTVFCLLSSDFCHLSDQDSNKTKQTDQQ